MAVAEVTVTFGILRDARASHDCCAAARPGASERASSDSATSWEARRFFTKSPRNSDLTNLYGVDVYNAPPVARKSHDEVFECRAGRMRNGLSLTPATRQMYVWGFER